MTVAPAAPSRVFDDLADAVQALREEGLRLSAIRRLVLEALFEADGPVAAERLAGGLKLDLASVYRNLDVFERHGLVRHVHLGHGPGLYALVGRGASEYLYCERCGTVRSLAPTELDPLRTQLRALFGYDARFSHHAIVGTCSACLAHDAGSDAGHEYRDSRGRDHEHVDGTVHTHAHPEHAHEHTHGDGEHAHVEHAHEHSHGDRVHSHPHAHPAGRQGRR